MAPMLAMLQEAVLCLGVVAARAERARRPTLHLPVIVDELVVEYTGAESGDAYADPHAPPKSAESSEPKHQVHGELVRG